MNLTAPPRALARSPVRSPLTEGGGGPSLDLNFLLGSMPAGLTFTRASSATYFDSTGTLQSASTNVPRFDYNPSTLAPRGLLIEEQRTNLIRNNTMVGAVAGTPGTYPTNWFTDGNLLSAGITQTIVGTGTEDGIAYIDIRYAGTTTGAGAFLNLFTESQTLNAASSGQVWASSAFLRLTAGSVSNVAVSVITFGRSNVGGNVESGATSPVPTTAALRTQRYSTPYTMANAATAFATMSVSFTVAASGAVVDFTIRIGLPQLERGITATSVIQTTGTAATRAQDKATYPASAFAQGQPGTLAADFVFPYAMPVNASLAIAPVVFLTNPAADRRVGFFMDNRSSYSFQGRVQNANGTSSPAIATQPAVGSNHKAAITWSSVQCAFTYDGAAPNVVAGSRLPIGMTSGLLIGAQANTVSLNGWIRRVRYWKRPMTTPEIQAVTV